MGLPALAAPPARRILVIDDDVRTARRLGSMLEEDGYIVEVMRNGTEAIERLAREPAPDAVITIAGPAPNRFASLGARTAPPSTEPLGPGIPRL